MVVQETLPTGRKDKYAKQEPASALLKNYEEENGPMSPLANQNSIYQITGQSAKKNKVNGDDTLEHTMSHIDEKFENLNNKIDSLGMAAEDYRGLLLMKLTVNDNRNQSVQNFSNLDPNISAKHQTDTVMESRDYSNQKITR